MASNNIWIKSIIASITDLEKVSEIVFEASRIATGSRHGFVGIIDYYTKMLLIKNFTSVEECLMKEKISVFYPDKNGLYPALFGYAINKRIPFYTNDPKSHPASKGVPEGHIPIKRFLAVPVILNDRVLGIIALANSEKDYTEDDLEYVKDIGQFFALALERYWFEEELKASKIFYELLFNNSPLPKIVIEENDIISQVNKAFEEFTGYSRYDVVKKMRWQQFVHKSYVKKVTVFKEMRLKGGPAPIKYKTKIIDKKGRTHDITVYAKIIPGTRNIIATWIDVTREKKLLIRIKSQQKKFKEYAEHIQKMVEEKVKELQEKEVLAALGLMTLMVAHDIRNPLQAITNYTFLLKEAFKHSKLSTNFKEEFTKYIQSIELNTLYIDKIVQDLNCLGKRDIKLEQVNLKTLVEKMLTYFSKQEHIKIVTDTDNVQAQLDPILIIRALHNLVLNSIQAMPNGGTITVQAKLKDNMIEFSVTDTGMGVPKEVKKNIFKPFYTTKSKGMGLGLTVVDHIVKLHDGTIEVESELNKGTKVTIKIPQIQNIIYKS